MCCGQQQQRQQQLLLLLLLLLSLLLLSLLLVSLPSLLGLRPSLWRVLVLRRPGSGRGGRAWHTPRVAASPRRATQW